MQIETYLSTKSMVLIITYASFPNFSKYHKYSQTVFDLD